MSNELSINQRPQFLANVQDLTGVEDFGKFIVPPRLKVVQPTSTGVYKEKFSPGDAVMVPQNVRITGLEVDAKNRPTNTSPGVIFTPVFFFAEFCAWNPLESRGALPMIAEQSFDPTSQVAIKARDFNRRYEPCPGYPGKMIRYVEHLNFIIMVHSEELRTMPILMSFSKAEHRAGTNFMALAKMRMAPLYSMKFVFNTVYRTNDKGQWYGIDVANPEEAVGSWVDDATYARLGDLHKELKEAHADKAIQVQHDEDLDTVEGVVHNTDM